MKYANILLALLATSCASGTDEVSASTKDEFVVIERYEKFVSELSRRPRERLTIAEMEGYLESSSSDGLRELIGKDEKARASLFSECGLLDVKSCFKHSQPARTVSFLDTDENKRLACIMYSQKMNGEGLIALAYMTLEKDEWVLIGTSQHEVDASFYPEAVANPEERCWNRSGP